MSLKLYFANKLGFIKPTAKIEAAHKSLLNDYQNFVAFEKSEELKEYQELNQLIRSEKFRGMKKEIQQLSFKGSREAAQMKELHKLESNGRLRKFYSVLNSEELKRFNNIAASELMKIYKEQKTAVEKHSLAALKRMDKQSNEYILYTEFQRLKDSPELTFFRNFRKSAGYRNFELMLDSPQRKRLEELRKITGTREFKDRVSYLEDKHKWEKTDGYKQEGRFEELRKLPQLTNYLKYKKSNAFDFFKKWNLVFDEQFSARQLDSQKWMTQSYLGSQALGRNFSQEGDLQAFTDGENVLLNGKSLKIEVRKEKAKGMQWRPQVGFTEQEFGYTSGIVSTAGSSWWKYGLLEAKVMYRPSDNIVNALCLLGATASPQINLIEMGAKNRVGLLSRTAAGIHSTETSLAGLTPGEYYIVSLEWSVNSMIWRINGHEILRLTSNIPGIELHLNATSVVLDELSNPKQPPFEIEWIRFYQHAK